MDTTSDALSEILLTRTGEKFVLGPFQKRVYDVNSKLRFDCQNPGQLPPPRGNRVTVAQVDEVSQPPQGRQMVGGRARSCSILEAADGDGCAAGKG